MDLTHADLVVRAVRWLRTTRGCGVVFAEMSCASSPVIVPDAIGWRAGGWSILVECKTSRSDFLADRKKPIHRTPDRCPGQERWYLTPPGLLGVDDLPPGWCLAEVTGAGVRLVHPTSLRWGAIEGAVFNRDRQVAEMPFLLSACRRHTLGVPFTPSTGRFLSIAEQDRLRGAP